MRTCGAPISCNLAPAANTACKRSSSLLPPLTATPDKTSASVSLTQRMSQDESIWVLVAAFHCPSCQVSPSDGAGAALRITTGPGVDALLAARMAASEVAAGTSFCSNSTLLLLIISLASVTSSGEKSRFAPGTITMLLLPSAADTQICATPLAAPSFAHRCCVSTPSAVKFARVIRSI